MTVAVIQPDIAQPVSASVLATTGLEVEFSAPVQNSELVNSAYFELRFGQSLVPRSCMTSQPDPAFALTPNLSTATVLRFVDSGPCTPPRTIPASLTVKGTIPDQYGVALGVDNIFSFTIAP